MILRYFGADYGVVITHVLPGGPAERAGLKRGDVITAIDGVPVRDGEELVNKIVDTPVGTGVAITYLRDKTAHTTGATVEDRAKLYKQEPQETPRKKEIIGTLGLDVEKLGGAKAKKLGLEAQGGLKVRDVEPGSFADEIGLMPGDIILELNGKLLVNTLEFRETEQALKGGSDIVFWLRREGVPLILGGTLPEK